MDTRVPQKSNNAAENLINKKRVLWWNFPKIKQPNANPTFTNFRRKDWINEKTKRHRKKSKIPPSGRINLHNLALQLTSICKCKGRKSYRRKTWTSGDLTAALGTAGAGRVVSGESIAKWEDSRDPRVAHCLLLAFYITLTATEKNIFFQLLKSACARRRKFQNYPLVFEID